MTTNPHRFPIFDSDNHMYETRDALTKYLPEHAKNAIRYVDIDGRTKIVVQNTISEFIPPNPTFSVVAAPGAQEDYFRNGNPDGKSAREIMGKPMKSIPAFRDPAARLEKLNEQGLDYALMFPTLASLVEERLKNDPELTHDVIHALNQWMYEHWSFDYEGRIFAVPVVTLPIVDRALEELAWCLERGAKTVLVRPAPVPASGGAAARSGSRSSTRSGGPVWTPESRCRCTRRTAATRRSSTSGNPPPNTSRSPPPHSEPRPSARARSRTR